MMAYDHRSYHGSHRHYGTGFVIACVLVVAIFVVLALLDKCSGGEAPDAEPGAAIRHDSLTHTYTHDGADIIRVYVVTDPDMGIQYVVSDHGGITPRLDRYGRQMGTVSEDAYVYD